MSGKIASATNQYVSIDQTVTSAQGTSQSPFRVYRLLDIIRNDGPGEAVLMLDGGAEIALMAGDYIGPWADFQCSTISIRCASNNSSCRIRALGV